MNTVLIVDSDLGFVFWLGQKLNEVGHHAWPAVSVSNAKALAARFDPNVLIVNFSLPGAEAFVKSFQRSHTEVRILALPSDFEARLEYLRDLNGVLCTEGEQTCARNGVLAVVGSELGRSPVSER